MASLKLPLALLFLLPSCTAYTFEQFEIDFSKSYSSSEERSARRTLFHRRHAAIVSHNSQQPPPSWKREVNHLTDRTDAELKGMRGLDRSLLHHQKRSAAGTAPAPRKFFDGPTDVDWRSKGVVTPVKNQGECGSCWTFASTETLESHWALKTGKLIELSEQFILDCTPNPHQCGGNGGCYGGTAELAYNRLGQLGGIPSEWTYPYISILGKNGSCHGLPLPPAAPHSGKVSAAATVSGHVSTPANSYYDILHAVATKGPLAVSVDAGAWHDYASGVFDGGNTTNPDLDHLVQLVGYGTEGGKDYWLVRNSWTTDWGQGGYIKLARHDPAKGAVPCGMDITPLDGNGCKGGPDKVKVCGTSGVLYDGVYPLV